jgi:hypothetical protein
MDGASEAAGRAIDFVVEKRRRRKLHGKREEKSSLLGSLRLLLMRLFYSPP